MRDRAKIESDAATMWNKAVPGTWVSQFAADILDLLVELDLYKIAIDDVFPVALRYGREYNVDNPSMMAQKISDRVTKQLRTERP